MKTRTRMILSLLGLLVLATGGLLAWAVRSPPSNAPIQALLVGTWDLTAKVTIDEFGQRSMTTAVPHDTFSFYPDGTVRWTYEVGSSEYTGTYTIINEHYLALTYGDKSGKRVAHGQTEFRLDQNRLILVDTYHAETIERVFSRSRDPLPATERPNE